MVVRDRASKVWRDPRDGSVGDVQRTSDLNWLERWIDTADPVHFGTFGGLWSKAVWFVFGIGLSALALTGAYLQVQRQRRKHGPAAVRKARARRLCADGRDCGGGRGRRMVRNSLVRDAVQRPLELSEVALPTVVIIGAWVTTTIGTLGAWVWKVR